MKCLIFFMLIVLFASTHAMINSERAENQPYYAYVVFASLQTSFYGGGALISFQHVLTCAANVRGFNLWRVGLGSNARSMHRTLTSNQAVVHPDYFEDLPNNIRLNDLGIITLLNTLEPSPNIFPIQFAPSSVQDLTNIQGMIVGFAGSTTIGNEGQENLQAGHVRVIPDDACLQTFPRGNTTLMFCAIDNTQRSNFCLGDQGGPLTTMLRGVEYMIGIASIPGCSSPASSYVRTSNYLDWIRRETGMQI